MNLTPILPQLVLTSLIAAQANWTKLNPTPIPSARSGHALAAGLIPLWVFAGRDALGDQNDLWQHIGGKWKLMTPTGTPPVKRRQTRMVWDVARSRLVVFGGRDTPNNHLNDTWETTGTSWVQVKPTTSPPVRWRHSLVYDQQRRQTILFGGQNATGNLSDTWIYDGTNWQQAAPTTVPPARRDSMLAYNSDTGETIMFGGKGAAGDLGDMYKWDGTNWTKVTPKGLLLKASHTGMAYDPSRKRMVIQGGRINGSVTSTDTWEFDGTTWLKRTPTTVPRLARATDVAYVIVDARVYMFGGFPLNNDFYGYATNSLGRYASKAGGCGGTGGAPTLGATTPWLGQDFTITVKNLPATGPAFLYVGLSDKTWGTISLPLNLGFMNAGNCNLNVSADFSFVLNNQSGTANWTVPIPNLAALAGVPFFNQVYAGGVPTSNPLGLVVSNYGEGKAGIL